jgi:hypothetical protein
MPTGEGCIFQFAEPKKRGLKNEQIRPLWKYLSECGEDQILLSFEDVRKILGFDIDHSFLNYKKELTQYGYRVGKISLKEKTVRFLKAESSE